MRAAQRASIRKGTETVRLARPRAARRKQIICRWLQPPTQVILQSCRQRERLLDPAARIVLAPMRDFLKRNFNPADASRSVSPPQVRAQSQDICEIDVTGCRRSWVNLSLDSCWSAAPIFHSPRDLART